MVQKSWLHPESRGKGVGGAFRYNQLAPARKDANMADAHDSPSGAVVPVPPQPPALRFEVSSQGMTSTYANFFRVAGTFEELLLDFGFHTGLGGGGLEAAKVSQRVIMTFSTAKRLLGALQAAIQRHEQTFGPIETDPQKRIRRP